MVCRSRLLAEAEKMARNLAEWPSAFGIGDEKRCSRM
jgi:hypothetical protein